MPDKAQACNNVVVAGDLAYATIDYCGVEILDVSNPANIRQLASWNPCSCHQPSNHWFNSGGHTNGFELDARRKRLYVSGVDSDLIVLDVSNPSAPRLVALLGEARDGLGTWDIAVHGGRMYGTFLRTVIPLSGRWSGVKAFPILVAPVPPIVCSRSRAKQR